MNGDNAEKPRLEKDWSSTEFYDGSNRERKDEHGVLDASLRILNLPNRPSFILGVGIIPDKGNIEMQVNDVEEQKQQQKPEPSAVVKTTDDDLETLNSSSTTWWEQPRVKEVYQTADWWSLWIGLMTFVVAIAVVFAVPLDQLDNVKYVIP
jgi:hypothetical protein